MKLGGKIGMEVTMWGKHKKIKHMKVYVTKGKKVGSSKVCIGNGWKYFKTTNELKVGDHVVFTVIATLN
jgi:hypothetical protein